MLKPFRTFVLAIIFWASYSGLSYSAAGWSGRGYSQSGCLAANNSNPNHTFTWAVRDIYYAVINLPTIVYACWVANDGTPPPTFYHEECSEGVSSIILAGVEFFCPTSEPTTLALAINNGYQKHNTCNPINIATGNKFFVFTEFSNTNINPLKLDIFYNGDVSNIAWTYHYIQSLNIASGYIESLREDGAVINFPVTSSSSIIAPSQRR